MTDDLVVQIDEGTILVSEMQPTKLVSVDLGGITTELSANVETVLFVTGTEIELIAAEQVWNQMLFVEEENLALLAWGAGGQGPAGPKEIPGLPVQRGP